MHSTDDDLTRMVGRTIDGDTIIFYPNRFVECFLRCPSFVYIQIILGGYYYKISKYHFLY